MPETPQTPRMLTGAWMGRGLLVAIAVYFVVAIPFAGRQVWLAWYDTAAHATTEFQKLFITALITLVGTGLTAAVALYAAFRQAATAVQVAQMGAQTSKQLAAYNAQMAETLARLKTTLDTGQVAYLELFGAATMYFHALRSAALGLYQEARLRAAEDAMIAASRHLIYVDDPTRNRWFEVWQRAQDVARAMHAQKDARRRGPTTARLLAELVEVEGGPFDLRGLHARLERTVKDAIEARIGDAAGTTGNPRATAPAAGLTDSKLRSSRPSPTPRR